MAMTIEQAKDITAKEFAQIGFQLSLEQIAVQMALKGGATADEADKALLRIDIAAFERNVIEYVADALSLKVANARYQIQKERKQK